MGLLDRFAARVAEEITKAPMLPSGAVTLTEQQMRTVGQSYGNSNPLERNPLLAGIPFSPGIPLIPGAINPVREDGRADPRRYEYLVAQNINITETRLVPFKTLRAAAEQIDILRRCIEVLKQKMMGLQWDIVLAEDATEKIIANSGTTSRVRALAEAKKEFVDEIDRARSFWEQPDPSNGLVFADWLNMALEEILVLDAWAVWPQKNVKGDLLGMQIIDGGTIKPLIDDRGMRPNPPHPAYQQILYGFPRTEFSAPTETTEADGEFTSDELSYMVRNRRVNSVYGYSPTERALTLAALYLRRQQWMMAEYTDGVLPELMFKTDLQFGANPQLLQAYENILNDALAGQTNQRVRGKVLPAGFDPVQMEGYGEKFKSTLDEYLVTSICGHFGVQPSEIGFSPKGGLGGAGFQEGEAQSSEVIGVLPLAQWIARMITNLSYVYLGMPRELEFKFMLSARHDNESVARAQDIEIRNGKRTLNEARSEAGLPLLDTPVADMPIFVTGAAAYVVGPDGMQPLDTAFLPSGDTDIETEVPAAEDGEVETIDALGMRERAEALGALIRAGVKPEDAAIAVGLRGIEFLEALPITLKPVAQMDAEAAQAEQAVDDAKPKKPVLPNVPEPTHQERKPKPAPTDTAMPMDNPIDGGNVNDETAKAAEEMRGFIRYLKKHPSREFTFIHIPAEYAEVLNKFVLAGDIDGARWYAKRYLDA